MRGRSGDDGTPAGPLSASARDTAWRLSALFGALFVVFGVQLTYLPVWLNSRGLSAAEISFAVSAPTFLRLIVTPGIGFIADRTNAHRLLVLGMCVTGVALQLVLSQLTSSVSIVVVVIAMLMAMQTLMPLIDTLTMRAVRAEGIDYGRVRLWGSATFILASYVAGYTVAAAGAGSVIWLLLTGALLTAFAASLLPRVAGSEAGGATSRRVLTLADMAALVADRRFIVFLVAASATQASHAVFYIFGVLHWRSLGLSAGLIGTLWAISVVAEIILFWASRRVVEAGPVPLMLIGAGAGIVRWTAMAFDPPVALLFPLQILHAGTFAATHLAAMHWIAKNTHESVAGTAQSLFSTASAGIGMGFAILISGWLYQAFSGRAFLAMTALCFIGGCAAVMLARFPVVPGGPSTKGG